jgi:lipid II:glycine glycyltransferase (peptidoglycan interpeptide bridge formation enzyme)
LTSKEKYIAYCAKHKVPLFFKKFWLDLYAEWDVIYAKENANEVFFVYCMEKKLHFKIIRNPYLTPYSGFYFSQSGMTQETRQKLIDKVLQALPNFHELQLDFLPSLGTGLNFKDFNMEKKVTNILPITDFQEVVAAYKPSLKRQIKKASKHLTVYEQDDIALFFQLHEKTFVKQNKKVLTPFKAFEQTWINCEKNSCGKLLFARDEQQNVHAALFLTFDEEQAYYLSGGTDSYYYGSGAMSLLMHTAIKMSHESGKKYFDFEGSMLPRVNKFFGNFSPKVYEYISISKQESTLLKIIKRLKSGNGD